MGTKSRFIRKSKKQSAQSWKPHAYQKKAMKFLLSRPHAGLLLDPGLGKTSITLGAISVLKKKGLFNGALIVAPLRVANSVWPTEVSKWKEFKDLKVTLLHGKGKRERAAKEDADIYIINFEGLPWLIEEGYLKDMLKDGRVDTLVVDELSKMKHPKTKRFKLLKPWLKKFKRRIGLTGSPAANGLMDLFGQIYILDRGAALGEYITHYRANYFIPVKEYVWKPRKGAEKIIYERIQDLVLRMDAEDYLELPAQVDNIIPVELPPKAAKLYEQLEEEMLAEIEGKTVTATTVATAVGKCKQVANGAVYTDQIDEVTGERLSLKKRWEKVHDEKIDALLDLIDEMQGQQILIAYEYQHDLERLLKALPKGTPYIGGGVTAQEATRLEREWNAGRIPILLGHPQSIGHGLNLQGSSASAVCWFSLTWDYELYDQFIRRLRRQGNDATRIFVHHILAKDTVDFAIFAALRSKQRTQDALLDALKATRRR